MQSQRDELAMLRSPETLEPSAGFYARVMQRIEERGTNSIWSAFIYSPAAKRLAFASLTLAVALGSYVATEESREGISISETVVAQNGVRHYDAPVTGSQAEQRDAVLENFATHPGIPR